MNPSSHSDSADRKNDPIAHISGVHFVYRNTGTHALDNLNLEVREGEMVALIGPSGAGKSTLCFLLNGLIPHFIRGDFTGNVTVDGENTRNRPVSSLSTKAGIVFQDFEYQLFSTTVGLEIAFGPENLALPRTHIRRRVNDQLEKAALQQFVHRQPASLSGGQKQRLAIASVMAMHPKLLILDEPATDLDPCGRYHVYSLVEKLRDRAKLTTVLVEHELEELARMDRIVVMNHGRIEYEDRPATVFSNPDRLLALGVKPLDIPVLFQKMGFPTNILTVENALTFLKEKRIAIHDGHYRRLVEMETEREHRYGPPVLIAEDVSFTYPEGVRALRGVSLSIRQGEFVALLGRNGSGKTTLAKHFNGLLKATEGRVEIFGMDSSGVRVEDIGKKIGYVFQNPDHQIFAQTVYDEVAFGLKIRGMSGKEIRVRVDEVLKNVGLEGCADEDPFSMTKGKRQCVAVASILAAKPDVLILDEPTTGLDFRELREVMELIETLSRRGITIIIITHSMWVAAQYAHRTVVFEEGTMVADGATRDIFSREDLLRAHHLRPPQIVRMSSRIGYTFLSVAEMEHCIR
jgi:energy-coupling factor transport system ATP-binding protein